MTARYIDLVSNGDMSLYIANFDATQDEMMIEQHSFTYCAETSPRRWRGEIAYFPESLRGRPLRLRCLLAQLSDPQGAGAVVRL